MKLIFLKILKEYFINYQEYPIHKILDFLSVLNLKIKIKK